MIGHRLPLVLALLLFLGCAGLTPVSAVPPSSATPVAPAATPAYGGFEMPGAVAIALHVENTGNSDDRLLGGSSPLGAQVLTHQTRLVAGRQGMFSLPDGIPIPAGTTVVLEAGASHLMLVDLRATLVQGRTFPLTLHFARAGDVEVTVRVRRKVDAAGTAPIPPVVAGDLVVSLASAPPTPVSRLTPKLAATPRPVSC